MSQTFSEIIRRVGRTDKGTAHTYACWYDYWFGQLEREAPLNILEVGVCVFGGGCVLSLAEYFPNATIWAVDIDWSRCNQEVLDHPRIKKIKCDAYQPGLLAYFRGVSLDLVIDDASHEVADQIDLLKKLRPYLKDSGFYVVEDCCTGHWLPRLKELWDLGLQQTIVDRSTAKTYDNTLIRFDPVR